MTVPEIHSLFEVYILTPNYLGISKYLSLIGFKFNFSVGRENNFCYSNYVSYFKFIDVSYLARGHFGV